jgi:hypothetical protein
VFLPFEEHPTGVPGRSYDGLARNGHASAAIVADAPGLAAARAARMLASLAAPLAAPLAALALTPVSNTEQSINMSPAGARPATSAAKQPATPETNVPSSTSKLSPPAKTGKRARALSAAAPLCNCAP